MMTVVKRDDETQTEFAIRMATEKVVVYLRNRLATADGYLIKDANTHRVGTLEKSRLRGKAEGVRLAILYTDDVIHMIRNNDFPVS